MSRHVFISPRRARITALACLGLALVTLRAEDAPLPQTDAWLASQARETFDVDALAAKLKTPAEAYAFVRDEIADEPYRGIMKGAAGALLTRGANDWDKALLLARLLSAQGVEVKLVRGEISPSAARALADSVLSHPSAVDRLLASLPRNSLPAAATFEERAQEKLFDQQVADRARQVADAEKTVRPDVEPALPSAPRALPAAATSHVWVEAIIDGQPVELDPTSVVKTMGEAPASVADSWDPASAPDEAYHILQIRVLADWLKEGKIETQELLSNERRVSEQLGRALRIAIVPSTLEAGSDAHVPILIAGDDVVGGSIFHFLASAPRADAGVGGLLGGFGGATPAEDKPADRNDPKTPRLARLTVEIHLRSPELPEEVMRRVVLDRAEFADGNWRLVPALADDATVAGLLVQAWDTGLDVGAPHPLAVMEAESAALRTLDPARAALAEKHHIDTADIPGLAPAPQLLNFFLASGLKHHQLAGAGARSIHVRPRVAFLRHGFTLADWTQPQLHRLRYEEGIDLANAPFGFAGAPAAARELAVRAGLNDTALEQFVQAGGVPLNTFPLMAAAREKKISLRTARKPVDLDGVDVPQAIRGVLVDELNAGRVLVLPDTTVALYGTHAFGWWSIDPATGYVIGKMELGGAQALTERAETEEKVSEWTEQYVKIMGDALKCYEGEVKKALKQDVKAIVLGGEMAKTPDANTMIDCLRSAACDALKDYATGKLSSAFAEREVKALRDTLMNWFRKKAIDKAGEMEEAGCKTLLGG